MLNSYTFTDPKSDGRAGSNARSYLWAGLFGAPYVLFAGAANRFFHALALQIVCLGAFFCSAIAASFIPQTLQAAFLAIVLPVVLAVQAFGIVRLVRRSYRSRGWRVRRAD
jgi:hypothetical protein